MTSFAPKWTHDQRDAIYRASKPGGGGLTAKAVAEACRKGLGELEPFEIADTSAGRVIRQEKSRRDRMDQSPVARGPLREGVATLVRRAMSITERELARLDKLQSSRQLQKPLYQAHFSAMVKELGQLEKLTRQLRDADKPAPKPKPDQPDQEQTWLEQLATESSRRSSVPPSPLPETSGNRSSVTDGHEQLDSELSSSSSSPLGSGQGTVRQARQDQPDRA